MYTKKRKLVTLVMAAVAALGAFASCGKETTKKPEPPTTDGTPASVSVYMPDGAPAMSMAKLMKEDTATDNITYQVVEASTINTYVTGENPKADLCVLPLNLASKLLGTGETYKLVGAVTHGNLYMVSSDATVQYTRENLNTLVGKTVGVVQLQNVPGLTFKVVLNECQIAWQELTDGASPAADKVNLKAVTPDQVLPNATGIACFVAPEPAASVKVDKTPLEFVGDLQALYGSEKGYPQAVLVAKATLCANYGGWVDTFAASMTEAATWVNATTTQPEEIVNAVKSHLTSGLTPSLSTANLSATAIAHSGVRFEKAIDYKTQINAFLEKLVAVNPSAAKAVADGFYYTSAK